MKRWLKKMLAGVCVGILFSGSSPVLGASVDAPEDTEVCESTEDLSEDEIPLTDANNNFVYVINSKNSPMLTVTYMGTNNKSAKTVRIPKTVTIDGVTYKVTAVADDAFKGNKTVTKITVPDSVITIGADAFSNCTSLKTLTISANVTSIGENAFRGCKKLRTLTIRSAKLTSGEVGRNAFKGLTKKTTIKVPKSKVAAYRKLFKNRGLSSKVKITK